MFGNLLRAIFWTAVTAAFIPAGFSAAPDGLFAREAQHLFISSDAKAHSTQLGAQAQAQTHEFCQNQSEACAVGEQFLGFTEIIATIAGQRAQDWAHEQLATAPSAQTEITELDAILADMNANTSARK